MKYFDAHSWLYFNDTFVKAEEARMDLFNQSLHYGYSALEGIRAYNTHNGPRLFKAAEHFERLRQTCDRIGLAFPWNVKELVGISYDLLEKNNVSSAYIRPLVISSHNMFLRPSTHSDLVIALWEWGPFLGNGEIRVTVSPYQRPNSKSVPSDIKASGQYLSSILATTAAIRSGYDEAILLDQEGNVAQASSNNLFIEKDGKLLTPEQGHIFPGITRQTVFEIALGLGIEVVEKKISVEELKAADSAFLTGTATGIVNISSVDESRYKEAWEDTLGASIQRRYKHLVHEKENFEVII